MKTRMSGAILLFFVLTACTFGAFAQSSKEQNKEIKINHKYSISIPVIILPQLVEQGWNDRINTQHIEFHVKRKLDDKNIVGVKFATWRLFQPMGILW